MDGNLLFLNLDGLDDSQVKHLNGLLHPSNLSPEIEFPWTSCDEEKIPMKGAGSSLNVHAPVFEAYVSKISNHALDVSDPHYSGEIPFNHSAANQTVSNSPLLLNYAPNYSALNSRTVSPNYSNGSLSQNTYNTYNQTIAYSGVPKTVNGDIQPKVQTAPLYAAAATFKLNPAVSCFVPSNFQKTVVSSSDPAPTEDNSETVQTTEPIKVKEELKTETIPHIKQNGAETKQITPKSESSNEIPGVPKPETATSQHVPPSWADIVSKGQKPAGKTSLTTNKIAENGEKTPQAAVKEDTEAENLSVEEDKLALVLGKHLHQLTLSFEAVFLQPRGLINRRNWCYINATLQALLACPPFYTLLTNLPLTQGLERGKSATPVIDSMMKVAQECSQFESPQEEFQPGTPFQPDFIYDMLRDLKSDCLKGQQEDAEEFLSFILNGMHEEMVKIIKNYEKKNHFATEELKENGDVSEGEEEWQVIGSKHKGMVTRKVVEHKTPISELLGGQIKSFLTTSGSKTSASIQPFFTLQLDVQSENVTSVSEALKEMTLKEPIQGYTCAKTKQEVEAYGHIALQKLPPVLILHLKRFVYNKNGGCKKVLKKTDYPIELELSRDLFSSDVKKNQRIRLYKLFAVMYHDGEEAIKGHYISDVYNHGSQTWVRCDDRTISIVSEAQVLSHSPPRVPYLLFYQES